MKIEFFDNQSGEPFALLTEGHVALPSFEQEARAAAKTYGVDLAGATLGHFHIRDRSGQVRMSLDDEEDDDDHHWHMCEAQDIGALPITAFKF